MEDCLDVILVLTKEIFLVISVFLMEPMHVRFNDRHYD